MKIQTAIGERLHFDVQIFLAGEVWFGVVEPNLLHHGSRTVSLPDIVAVQTPLLRMRYEARLVGTRLPIFRLQGGPTRLELYGGPGQLPETSFLDAC